MALVKTRIGNNEDGTAKWHYEYSGPEGGGVIKTGPVSGTVTLADGTVYNVTDEFIEHAPGHGNAIAFHIAKMHESSGRLGQLVHGNLYAGPPVMVVGDESNFTIETGAA
jgi:hypothetical protein